MLEQVMVRNEKPGSMSIVRNAWPKKTIRFHMQQQIALAGEENFYLRADIHVNIKY